MARRTRVQAARINSLAEYFKDIDQDRGTLISKLLRPAYGTMNSRFTSKKVATTWAGSDMARTIADDTLSIGDAYNKFLEQADDREASLTSDYHRVNQRIKELKATELREEKRQLARAVEEEDAIITDLVNLDNAREFVLATRARIGKFNAAAAGKKEELPTDDEEVANNFLNWFTKNTSGRAKGWTRRLRRKFNHKIGNTNAAAMLSFAYMSGQPQGSPTQVGPMTIYNPQTNMQRSNTPVNLPVIGGGAPPVRKNVPNPSFKSPTHTPIIPAKNTIAAETKAVKAAKKSVEDYNEHVVLPMSEAIKRHGLVRSGLPVDRFGRVRDLRAIIGDKKLVNIALPGAEQAYISYKRELENLVGAYRKMIYTQEYAPAPKVRAATQRGVDWFSVLDKKWSKKIKSIAKSEDSDSLEQITHKKLGRYALKFKLSPTNTSKNKKEEIENLQEEIDILATSASEGHSAWRKSMAYVQNRNAAYEYGGLAHKSFEKFFIETGALEEKCRDADELYALTFKSKKKWTKWAARAAAAAMTVGALFGIYWAVKEYYLNENKEDPDPTEPDEYIKTKSGVDLEYDLIQGQSRILNATDFFRANVPFIPTIDQTYGDFGTLRAVVNGSQIHISSPAPENDPGVGSYEFRINVRQDIENGAEEDQEITINYKDSPVKYEGETEAQPIEKDGDKPYKTTINELDDLQDIADVSMRIEGGKWNEIYNSTDGPIQLPLEEVIKLNRTIRAQARATAETRIRDARGNEYIKASETEVKDFVTNVTGGQIDKNEFKYNNTDDEAGKYTVQFEAVDWDGIDDASQHSDLTIKLTDAKGKEITDTADLNIGQNSINLTYKAGLAPGNCTLEVTHGGNVIFEDEGYIWQDPAKVELKTEDGEYDFLLGNKTTNHTVEATVTNEEGQLTTVAFAVNGQVVANETFDGTETKEVTLEGFVQGENIVGAMPSDYDSINNPYIDSDLATTDVIFNSVNHAPNLKADGNLSRVINNQLPLTRGYGRNITLDVYDLFEDIDGDDLEITKDGIVFTGGQGTYDNETKTLYLRPTAGGLQTINVFAKEKDNPDSSPITASAKIKINQQISSDDLDCYTSMDDNGDTTIYFNGAVEGGAGNLNLEAVVMNGDQEVKIPLNLVDGKFNITSGQLGLSPGVYPVTVGGHDENNAPLVNSPLDDIIVMPTDIVEGTNYAKIAQAVKLELSSDPNYGFGTITDNADKWKNVFNITCNAVAVHGGYYQGDFSNVPKELKEAIKYVYETVIPDAKDNLDKITLMPTPYHSTASGQIGYELLARTENGEEFWVIPDRGVKPRSYYNTYALPWDGAFPADEKPDAVSYAWSNLHHSDFEDAPSFDKTNALVSHVNAALQNARHGNDLGEKLKRPISAIKLYEGNKPLKVDHKDNEYLFDAQ